jgi:hypothetical protein
MEKPRVTKQKHFSHVGFEGKITLPNAMCKLYVVLVVS